MTIEQRLQELFQELAAAQAASDARLTAAFAEISARLIKLETLAQADADRRARARKIMAEEFPRPEDQEPECGHLPEPPGPAA